MDTQYRGVVIISGVEDQYTYGSNAESVKKRAIKLLTEHPDGYANTHPKKVVLQSRSWQVRGKGGWSTVEIIEYKDL